MKRERLLRKARQIIEKGVVPDLQENSGKKAALAIQGCLERMLYYELCETKEILCLIDPVYKSDWPTIAGEIARKAEILIRKGELHPNALKPWQNCSNYPTEFRKISQDSVWRHLHSAIDAINQSIKRRFTLPKEIEPKPVLKERVLPLFLRKNPRVGRTRHLPY